MNILKAKRLIDKARAHIATKILGGTLCKRCGHSMTQHNNDILPICQWKNCRCGKLAAEASDVGESAAMDFLAVGAKHAGFDLPGLLDKLNSIKDYFRPQYA